MKKTIKKDDFIAGDDWPMISQGNYEAVCIKHEKGWSFGRNVLFLHWKIIDQLSDAYNEILFQPFNANYRKFTMGTKYYKAWCLANGSKPKRGDRMSPLIFRNKVFLVKVVTVKREPDFLSYSKVDEIIECCTVKDNFDDLNI